MLPQCSIIPMVREANEFVAGMAIFMIKARQVNASPAERGISGWRVAKF